MNGEQNEDLELIQHWFEEQGFRLSIEREDEALYWADLIRLPSGRIVAPRYGRGNSKLAAARRAKERYAEEQ